ncbi:MAG: hypothetical protein LBD82_03000 [Deltaproteobacteria bacterium]|nr:hypothetical protein [Deltaproteobacteria bacterium]
MEQTLLKLVRQLNKYDEASLMELWQRYASKVSRFEPSERWEEAALVLCLIQSVHWKNQLYNAELAAGARRGKGEEHNLHLWMADLTSAAVDGLGQEEKNAPKQDEQPKVKNGEQGRNDESNGKPCRIMLFRPEE